MRKMITIQAQPALEAKMEIFAKLNTLPEVYTKVRNYFIDLHLTSAANTTGSNLNV